MINTEECIAMGVAHSKMILTGDHVVVHGKPAIAIPFPLHIKTYIYRTNEEITLETQMFKGSLHEVPEKLRGIQQLIIETLSYMKQHPAGIHIVIKSDIPIGQGLGSSAAAGVSVVRALYKAYDQELCDDRLKELVNKAEIYAHGKPSGIDMTTVISQQPVYYEIGKKTKYIELGGTFTFLVGDTGNPGDTKTAVANVRKRMEESEEEIHTIMDSIESIVFHCKEALLSGEQDLLGKIIYENHQYLEQLGVSDEQLNHLVQTAMNNGALGAKLTGGGLGGCMIALVKDYSDGIRIGQCLLRENAKRVWCFTTGESSAHEIFLEVQGA